MPSHSLVRQRDAPIRVLLGRCRLALFPALIYEDAETFRLFGQDLRLPPGASRHALVDATTPTGSGYVPPSFGRKFREKALPSIIPRNTKTVGFPGLSRHSGGGIRTRDLRVMSCVEGGRVRSGCPCLLGLGPVRWGPLCSERNPEWNLGGAAVATARERGQCSSTVLEHFPDARSKLDLAHGVRDLSGSASGPTSRRVPARVVASRPSRSGSRIRGSRCRR